MTYFRVDVWYGGFFTSFILTAKDVSAAYDIVYAAYPDTGQLDVTEVKYDT